MQCDGRVHCRGRGRERRVCVQLSTLTDRFFLQACLLQCRLFLCGVTQLPRFRVFMFQWSFRCIGTCVLVVLEMRTLNIFLESDVACDQAAPVFILKS